MKYYNYLSLVTLFLVMGCNSENVDEEHHYDNKLYITSATITDDLLIKADVKEATRSLSYRLASPANQDISITFDAAPALTASYNMNYDDHAEVLLARRGLVQQIEHEGLQQGGFGTFPKRIAGLSLGGRRVLN